MRRRAIIWAPLALAAFLLALFAFGQIRPADRQVRSAMIGKPLPAFALPAAVPSKPGLASTDLGKGEPRLINVFASWCVPCAAEAPQLVELQRRGVAIDAIAIRDRPQDVAAFLQRYGDPFARIGRDDDSRVQLAMGSSGVPETFVVDGRGIIRHQHLGNITPEDVPDILAALEAAR